MNIELHASELSLARDGMIALRDARDLRITCLTGVLWITQANDTTDIILGPGQSYAADCASLTLLTAMEATTLALREASIPMLGRRGGRIAQWLATLLPRQTPTAIAALGWPMRWQVR